MRFYHPKRYKVSFVQSPNFSDIILTEYLLEAIMSTCTHETMTNNHASDFLAQIGETFHVWRERGRQRRELSRWTERDLHDVGLSWSDIVHEAEKPFWRA
jgi:uncharacterized protein YjiS (DUF1127 family)